MSIQHPPPQPAGILTSAAHVARFLGEHGQQYTALLRAQHDLVVVRNVTQSDVLQAMLAQSNVQLDRRMITTGIRKYIQKAMYVGVPCFVPTTPYNNRQHTGG